MPRKSKGARLWFRDDRRDAAGTVTRPGAWFILDGPRQIGTGAGRGDRRAAETALARYLERKYRPDPNERDPARIPIADVLSLYLEQVAPGHAREIETAQRFATLIRFWCDPDLVRGLTGARFDAMLADVTGTTCRAYAAWRCAQAWKSARPASTGRPARMVSPAAARRELEDLRAAIRHHHREGLARELVAVTLPDAPLPRQRWLTRSEAARLLMACWRARDPLTRAPRRRHVARFILVALYSGSRAGAVCAAALAPQAGSAWVDLERGILHRRGSAERETAKRRPPAAVPARLLAHMRRWTRKGIAVDHLVEWQGAPVRSVRKGFASAARDAGLGPGVTPHVLRHTAATWAMQNRGDLWQVAGWLGMSVELLAARYGHHHPEHHRAAAEAVSRRPGEARPANETPMKRLAGS